MYRQNLVKTPAVKHQSNNFYILNIRLPTICARLSCCVWADSIMFNTIEQIQ